MTENEAIKELKEDCNELGKAIPCDTGWGISINRAYSIAIQALEEIQQYRAIGTVEEIQQKDEVIATQRDIIEGVYKDYEKYLKIGTIEEFKALKEKNVAKKPHSISIANDIGNSMVECPICHARSDYDVKSIKRGHCWKCGQKLDWSE